MLVFKFGGASVKNAEAIKKIPHIIEKFEDKLCIIISAIDKTTNQFEILVDLYFHGKAGIDEQCNRIKKFHFNIVKDLFKEDKNAVKGVEILFDELNQILISAPSVSYDFEYDQIVPFGELLSTTIISSYLNYIGCHNKWLDAREIFITNSKHRDATVNFELSSKKLEERRDVFKNHIIITQGFIGSLNNGISTTLGREGSDYSGAVLAYLLDAQSLTVWKDVDGILTADPQWRKETTKLNTISYKEAIELAFFGAKVIHPKTIKPLQNKKIPLFVKSFLNPDGEGTIISNSDSTYPTNPVFIRKENQILLSIIPKDFSFVAEDNLSQIFSILAENNVKVNLMQNSAVSFSLCFDFEQKKFESVIVKLKQDFNIRYNLNLELITIRHYTAEAIKEIINDREIILEQRSRNTVQFVLD